MKPHLICRVPSGVYLYSADMAAVVYYPNEGPLMRHAVARTRRQAAEWIDNDMRVTGERPLSFSGKI